MTTHIHSESPLNQPPETDGTIARQTENAAKEAEVRAAFSAQEATDTTRDAARRATETAKDIYHSAALKAEETLTTSKEYVRRNPVPAVLGAIAFGAAVGYMLILSSRRKPTFGERYVDEPFDAVREAILGALSPVTQSVHRGYGSARDGAGKAMGQLHRLGSGHKNDSFSNQIGRFGNNLKFW